jgi:gamma-butyrobetaine dioxygenase/trimethyllysine dioxygenase
MAPHQVPFEQMESWYRAYNRFTRLVGSPQHQYRFGLRAGDFLMYDNFRMLHARTAFAGARWVRGIYFN